MLAVMENKQPSTPGPSCKSDDKSAKTPDNGQQAKEFLATGRTGRRNALPDILSQTSVASSDLPNQFQALSTTEHKHDKSKEKPGPSNRKS